jgi:conjugative transfer signal peptidase TraF
LTPRDAFPSPARGSGRPGGRLPRGATIALAALLLLALASTLLQRAGWSLSLQVTGSLPRGLYLVTPARRFAVGDIVLLDPPTAVAPLMLERRWIGAGMKLMKPIVALAGDEVCLRDGSVFVNGRAVAPVFAQDRSGRPLPRLDFCRRLVGAEAFLLSDYTSSSFDSRYFGPVATSQLQGRALPL